jgi:hypothetical protein
MNEFKFDCPTCGQHMLAAHEWIGQQIECPSCNTSITIPEPQKPTPTKKPQAKAGPSRTGSHLTTVDPSATASKQQAAQPPGPPPPKAAGDERPADAGSTLETKTAPGGDAPPAEGLRVAVLTPAIKLDIVRAVRERIKDPSAWLPEKIDGADAYAAKVMNGETVLVGATSPEANRFSLIGAFLIEFHVRQVVRTATGRTRMLNEEIPDAIRKALQQGLDGKDRRTGEDPLAQPNRQPITHEQCLAALDTLERRYSRRVEQMRVEKARRTLGNMRVPDLVRKLEVKGRIAPEDVAAALYHELVEVRRRLDELEKKINPDK